MAEYIDNRTAASGPNSVTKNDPYRTDAVDDAYKSRGSLKGGETKCTICQEEMQLEDYTVTHCKCENSLHEECFNDLVTSSTYFLDTEPKPTKCPLCREEMKPWPTSGASISPEMEAVKIDAIRPVAGAIRAVIKAGEADSSEDSSEEDEFEEAIATMRARVEALEEALRDETEEFAAEADAEAYEANLRTDAMEAAAAAATARFEAFGASLRALQARRQVELE